MLILIVIYVIKSWPCSGTRQPGKDDGLVTQRKLDGDGGPLGIRQVLAEQHEQRQDVSGPQRSD